MFFTDYLVVYVFRTVWRLMVLLRTRKWERVNAVVLMAEESYGLSSIGASVSYEYAVGAQKFFSGTFTKPFLSTGPAQAYVAKYPKGSSFKIRVKPGHPEVSVADVTVENWWSL